jgi:hypothetical protein
MLELLVGLVTGREALWPSEPHHSPDKAIPSYYSMKESFCKWNLQKCDVCVDFHRWGGGVFIVTSTRVAWSFDERG